MLDLSSIVEEAPSHTRESAERDTLIAHIVAIADSLPRLERAQVVRLDALGEMVDDPTLGSFDLTEVEERTLANAKQNSRNWTRHAVEQNYPGFADGKFEVTAIPVREAGKTVAVKFALRGLKAKARDEI